MSFSITPLQKVRPGPRGEAGSPSLWTWRKTSQGSSYWFTGFVLPLHQCRGLHCSILSWCVINDSYHSRPLCTDPSNYTVAFQYRAYCVFKTAFRKNNTGKILYCHNSPHTQTQTAAQSWGGCPHTHSNVYIYIYIRNSFLWSVIGMRCGLSVDLADQQLRCALFSSSWALMICTSTLQGQLPRAFNPQRYDTMLDVGSSITIPVLSFSWLFFVLPLSLSTVMPGLFGLIRFMLTGDQTVKCVCYFIDEESLL